MDMVEKLFDVFYADEYIIADEKDNKEFKKLCDFILKLSHKEDDISIQNDIFDEVVLYRGICHKQAFCEGFKLALKLIRV